VGGTAYTAAQPAGSGFGAGGDIGGGTHVVYAGVLATPAPGNLANTQSIIQSMMTELGIS
jgi:hypothetical protein